MPVRYYRTVKLIYQYCENVKVTFNLKSKIYEINTVTENAAS